MHSTQLAPEALIGPEQDMYLEIKVMGGENIDRVAAEACALANRIGCDVHFRFNDVLCMALQQGDPAVLVENWKAASESKSQYPIATTHPRHDNGSGESRG